jgi:hypothetical protein
MKNPDIDQILDSLPYETSKQSFAFSLRPMINKNLLERGDLVFRRGKKRRVIRLTELGKECAKRYVF